MAGELPTPVIKADMPDVYVIDLTSGARSRDRELSREQTAARRFRPTAAGSR